MSWRRPSLLLTRTLVLAAASAAFVCSAQTPSIATADDRADAKALLIRVHEAAHKGNYHGTLVFSAAGMLASARVWHYSVGEHTFERLEALDGRQQRIYRHNDLVHTLWPQLRTAVVEQREALAAMSTTPQAVDPRALDSYTLRREGLSRVAGREAQVFLLDPLDGLRYAQRLWADRVSALMLRADVIGPHNVVLESSAFSQVEVGVKPQPDVVMLGLKNPGGYQVVRLPQQHTRLEAEGWSMAGSVPGFALASCTKRPLQAAASGAQGVQGVEPVLQAVFSDGLTHVSVFIEPFDARAHGEDRVGQIGATGTAMKRHGDHWITAMGNVPAPTLLRFIGALRRQR